LIFSEPEAEDEEILEMPSKESENNEHKQESES
jgi:hypothetical protein